MFYPTIGIVAGEMSGDLLGARIICTLLKYLPRARFFGIAGPKMRSNKMEVWYKSEEISTVGIFETVKYLPRILSIRKNVIYRFIALKPDVFIGIDSPDFNLKLEKCLKEKGIKTVHYVSPSVWAWRKNRISKIRQAIDKILLLFPFEEKIYEKFKIPYQYVGHTLADSIPLNPNKKKAREILNISPKTICLSLLPGSREREISTLSEDFLRTASLLRDCFSNLKILVPLISRSHWRQFERIKSYVAPNLSVKFLENQSHLAMIASDVTILASGTASLECMFAKCPMIVAYRLNMFTFIIGKYLIKTEWISLPNLLAGRKLVKEFLQTSCNPDRLAREAYFLLTNNDKRSRLVSEFTKLHRIVRNNADEKIAQVILEMINFKI